jgi:hypothetical protein
LKVLLDHNLSPHIAAAMDALVRPRGHQVVALQKRFPPHTADEVWIRALGQEGGWVVISGDVRITKNAAERNAWRQAGLIGFFLMPVWRKYDPLGQTARLLLWWEKLVVQAQLVKGGAIYQLPINVGNKLKQLPY